MSQLTYRFELRDEEGTTSFGADQVQNWDSLKPSITVSSFYKGLHSKFTNSFEFVDDIGRRMLRLVDNYGSGANAYLKIFIGNGNKERSSFKQLGNTEFKANFQDFKRGGKIGVTSLNFAETGFQERLLSRDDEPVNYDTFTSLDGEEITPFTEEFKTCILHDRTIPLSSVIRQNKQGSVSYRRDGDPGAFTSSYALATVNVSSSIDDIKNVASTNLGSVGSYFYLQSEEVRELSVIVDNYTYSLASWDGESDGFSFIDFQIELKKYDVDFNFISTEYQSLVATITPASISTTLLININQIVQLNVGESLRFEITVNGNKTTGSNIIGISQTNENLINLGFKTTSSYPKTTANVILPLELFSRLCQVYTGVQLPFYSELFGRTELGYNEDGEWAYLCKASGKMIRNFPYGEYVEAGETKSNNYNSSLRDEFAAYNSILNLGATIEIRNGQPTFRIERYSDLLDTSNIIDLGEVLADPTRENNNDWMFKSVRCGYKNQEYEKVSGLGAFNGEFHYGVPLAIKDKKYDIVCKDRADDIGTELTRRLQYSDNPTLDNRADDDNFFIHAKPGVGADLEAVKSENFSIINNTPNPDKIYNAEITPRRNLLRHADIIRSGLIPNTADELIYIKGAKNPELQTQLLTETSLLVEKANIPISSLPIGKIKAEFYNIKIPFTIDQWFLFIINPNNLCKFVLKNKEYYGFLDDFAYELNDGQASVKLKVSSR